MNKTCIAIAVLVLVGVTMLLWRPVPSYDLAKVYPALRDLPKPYRSVRANWFSDGGSLSMEVIGTNGTALQFAFPVHVRTNGGPKYPQLFVGGLHLKRKPGEVQLTEIANSPDTRAMLIRLIATEANQGLERDLALAGLRGMPGDYVAFALAAGWNKFRSDGR